MQHRVELLRIQATTDNEIASMNTLLQQLKTGVRTINKNDVEELLDEGSEIAVARDASGTIVGMATLIVYHKLAKGIVGMFEDVVIDSKHREQGVATMLLQKLIEIARARDLVSIRLTSSHERAQAHRLYEKLGFVKVDTNFYGLIFR